MTPRLRPTATQLRNHIRLLNRLMVWTAATGAIAAFLLVCLGEMKGPCYDWTHTPVQDHGRGRQLDREQDHAAVGSPMPPSKSRLQDTETNPGRVRFLARCEVTAYCPCAKCCGTGSPGITASKEPVSANGGRFVAADPGVPFGTKILVPGYAGSVPVPVLDRGAKIKGNRLDVFFPTHKEALAWGRRTLTVELFPKE